ncbi:hypothetical protein JCM10207_001828 [Rhodosporidiobolus poonsookiae]
MAPPSGTRPPPSPHVAALRTLVASLRTNKRAWLALLAAALAVLAVTQRDAPPACQPNTQLRRAAGGRDEAKWGDGVEGEFPPLQELRDRDRLWPPDLDKPLCTPKIYVYDLPPSLRLPESTVSQCRWSAYNSELLLHDLLVKPPAASPVPADHPHHTLFTSNPDEADFFFVPLFPACNLFNCWVRAGWTKTERCNVDEGYTQPVMQHIREAHPHWNASGGADHLLTHPMDYVDGYYTTESRAAMNASTYLVTVGDLRPAPYGKYFRAWRDLVIPSSTHLLNSYFLNPMDYLDEHGRPLETPRGNAHPKRRGEAAPSHAEIFVPSPPAPLSLLDRLGELFYLLRHGSAALSERDTLAIFRGGVGEPTDGESYSLGIRSLFFPSSGDPSLPPFSSTPRAGFSSLPDFDIAPASEPDDYARRLARSKFGLAPPGYTLDTTRLYEYLAFGVVPVFIGTGPRAGQVLPFETDIDWASFSLFIPRERAHETPRILRAVGEEEYERLRRNVWEVGRKVVLEGREGNVWKLLARQLCRMKRLGGLSPGEEIANN